MQHNTNFNAENLYILQNTPLPLYYIIVGVEYQFLCWLSNPCYNERKMHSYIAKSLFNDHLESSNDLCYIKNCVIMNSVIKRLRCNVKMPINNVRIHL